MDEYGSLKVVIACLCVGFLVLAVKEIGKKVKFFFLRRGGGYMVGHFADRNGSIRSMRSTAKPHEYI